MEHGWQNSEEHSIRVLKLKWKDYKQRTIKKTIARDMKKTNKETKQNGMAMKS